MRILLGILLGLWVLAGYAAEDQPLSSDKAFALAVELKTADQLAIKWQIAPGYYLYADRITITSDGRSVEDLHFPKSTTKTNSLGEAYQVYLGDLALLVPIKAKANLNLSIHYQGCAAKGFCYPPIDKKLKVDATKFIPPMDLTAYINHPEMKNAPQSEQDYVKSIFMENNFVVIFLSFLGFGFLLSLTPCVLPMIPILSGIIMGHRKKELTTLKSFLLSLAYVLGMAFSYAIAGVIVALIGSRIQTELQRTWVIVIFSGIFVLMALSLFGVFKIQLPNHWQQRLAKFSNRQKGGTYLGVFLMGSVASLIVSPCISPPLVGILAYIAQSGNVWLGGFALFFLGIGMGLPLLLIGASAGRFLPKAGAWMEAVEVVMGFLMLGFAIWILSRIVAGPVTLFLWGVWLVSMAIYLGAFSRAFSDKQILKHSAALIMLIYGVILVIGSFFGNSNPLQPWDSCQLLSDQPYCVAENKLNAGNPFVTVTTMEALQEQLEAAKKANKFVLMDFYADWCESCVRMERYVFGRPDVQQALENFLLLRVDVTQNTPMEQMILKRFNVIAPPTLIIFDANGNELMKDRQIGEENAKDFLRHIDRIKKETERAN